MEDSWLAPFSVLSAVGLLLISTSARYSALHQYLRDIDRDTSDETDRLELNRAHLLSWALVLLYCAAAILSLTTASTVVAHALGLEPTGLLICGLALGVIALASATIFLIREALTSLRIHVAHSGP